METKEAMPLIFQKRDADILIATHQHDGVLARRHLKYLFWRDKSWRAFEKRLSKLKQSGYIEWPDGRQRKTFPIPEPIIWLGWKGALYLAGREGITARLPNNINENQLRQLEKTLRAAGFHWLREPRWSQLKHDLNVVDMRFWVNRSIKACENYSLEEWTNESIFRSDTDYIDYQVKTRDDQMLKRRKGIRPDGSFSIIDKSRQEKGEPFRARFLVEIDMATHDNPSFGMDKAAPGAAYIKSQEYFNRFNTQSGRWLVITTSPIRMRNLIQQTRERIGNDSNMFYFTRFDYCQNHNFFTDPIWLQEVSGMPTPLIGQK